jgi:outer membrane receptor protein involved in Fe transport
VDGRQLGFQDVVDPVTGNRYPAEAFLYGGRFAAIIPAGSSQYRDKAGDPQIQAGLNGTYRLGAGFGVLFSSNYFDAVWANRTKTIRLPRAITADAGVTYDKDKWQLRFSGYNIFNERYWQAAASDANAVLVTAKPGATWEFMIRKSF